ncbi:MAG: YfhO family protein [Chitinispirillia bacterium]|nr:YfhO family protein [Chitinispirillia bacterium]
MKTKKRKQIKEVKSIDIGQKLLKPEAAPFFNARNSVIFSIAVLAVLWLIQFFTVLIGSEHFWDDLVLQDYPLRIFARSAFYQLEFPHWNPFAFNGTLVFAAQVAGVLYPFNIVLSLLPVSDEAFWWSIQACLALHILIAGITMFVYLRFKKRSDIASLFGAIAFMFGGFLITHLVHTMMVYILAWFPLVLMYLEKAIAGLKPRHALIGGLLLGLTMLAGHPQFSFYQFIFMFAICAYLLYQKGRSNIVKGMIAIGIFFGIAMGIALVQYLPALEFSGLTLRTDYTIKDTSEGSLQFIQLITMLMPKVFGAFTGNPQVPPFWLEDSFRHGYYNYWETCFYFGISTLILACFWLRKIKTNRVVMFAVLWMIGSLSLALGGNFFVYRALFDLGVPGFTGFRHPARILFTWGILFPLMAAAVLDSLNELKLSGKLKIISLSLCVGAMFLGIFTASGGLGGFFPLMNVVEARAAYASKQGLILFFNAGALLAVFILFFKDIIKLRTAKVLIVSCLAIDMIIFAFGHHTVPNRSAPQEFSRAKSTVDDLKAMQDKELFRFNSRQYILEPQTAVGRQAAPLIMNMNQGTVSKIHITEGYTPLRLKNYLPPLNSEKLSTVLDLLNVKYYSNPNFRRDGTGGELVLLNETYLPRAKLFYNAKIISDNDSLILAYMNSPNYDHHNEVVISTDKDLKPFSLGQNGKGKVQITNYKFNKIELEVDSDREAILWLSEIWYPAWKATVNGAKTEVYRANYSFRAVVVPEGKSKVVFKFNSVYFNIGAWVSVLTFIISLTILISGSSIRKKSTKKAAETTI